MEFNSMDFTGKILSIEPDREGIIVILQQMVNNKFDTAVAAYIVPSLRESFLSQGFKPGDVIHIIGGQLYEKDGVCRLRISSKKQLPQMLQLNAFLLSGKITNIQEEDASLVLSVNQNVGGKIPTTFSIFVPGSVRQALALKETEGKEPFEVNDDIVIIGGTLYTKDGVIRIRVSNPDQIQKTHEDFYLGEEEARDKFI